ncbi:uncharacterized protein N7515_008453 [Penicillium bovifimosum]|uniref:Uncharacterized protein n=1 Tax=Penicillium bovifimosum TaxID=126998 RepID=A0A9W9KXV2_9EURO|nr:uncharacterized protein N7515_008453 [Penicillium bovifimosum]KAJ5124628.1 hypothetical protein N7515_008453 [Penicillium bovifimosum]
MKEEVACQITRPIPIRILKRPEFERAHQEDADRRDAAIQQAERRERSREHVKKVYNHSHKEDTLVKMERSLRGQENPGKERDLTRTAKRKQCYAVPAGHCE